MEYKTFHFFYFSTTDIFPNGNLLRPTNYMLHEDWINKKRNRKLKEIKIKAYHLHSTLLDHNRNVCK